ncbi:MAG: hypothetical protein IKN12_12880, partial [Selenomonadaceae bacterium]|nr:hypothetical protein [Selenomonadaceae bacterium]
DTPDRGLSNLFTSRLSGFPDALICTVNLTTKGGVSAEPIEAGIILLEEPENASEQMGQSWQIGMDFGTSSTMLYYRNGTNPPQPLDLQPNLFDVTDSGMLGLRTYLNFIPSSMENRQAGSFLSIFQLLNGKLLHGHIPTIRPLQDGNVFWLSTADGPDAVDFKVRNSSGQIDANLKWKGDTVGNLKVSAYIKQICLQSLAEAAKRGVGTISWNFSYPTAFSASQTMTFETTCKNAVNEGMADSGLAVGTIPVNPPEYWPESKASAYYFSKLGGVAFAGGAVCLDIGAGTTDISIISDRPARIVYHTSLQFAGRYLFKSIYKHYDLFAPSLKLDGMGPEQRNALIDADMRRRSDEYLYSLVTRAGEPAVIEVLQIAQFAVAGIFYYLGGLLGLLHKKGIYKGNSVPDIYVGGNGSRIFPWICAGSFATDNPYISVLQDMLAKSSGLPADFGFRLILSDTPKVEVARGMIEDKPSNHKIFFNAKQQAEDLFGKKAGQDLIIANSVFSGDKFILEGNPMEKTDFISAYDIEKGIGVTNVDELRAFAEAFNENQYVWGQKINISNSQYAGVTKAVEGTYAQQVGMNPNDIFVEPVFILALKGYMDMI